MPRVDGVVGKRQMALVNEHAQLVAGGGPHETPLRGRNHGPEPQRFAAERAEIGRRETEADEGLARDAAPTRADAMREQPAYHQAERPGVEIPEIGDIELHWRFRS